MLNRRRWVRDQRVQNIQPFCWSKHLLAAFHADARQNGQRSRCGCCSFFVFLLAHQRQEFDAIIIALVHFDNVFRQAHVANALRSRTSQQLVVFHQVDFDLLESTFFEDALTDGFVHLSEIAQG